VAHRQLYCVAEGGEKYPAKEPIAHYFRNNFYLTRSGNFRTQTPINAMLEIGADRILFSTDWPFENAATRRLV
jgi:gamma-resorcylate decarboxylase